MQKNAKNLTVFKVNILKGFLLWFFVFAKTTPTSSWFYPIQLSSKSTMMIQHLLDYYSPEKNLIRMPLTMSVIIIIIIITRPGLAGVSPLLQSQG